MGNLMKGSPMTINARIARDKFRYVTLRLLYVRRINGRFDSTPSQLLSFFGFGKSNKSKALVSVFQQNLIN